MGSKIPLWDHRMQNHRPSLLVHSGGRLSSFATHHFHHHNFQSVTELLPVGEIFFFFLDRDPGIMRYAYLNTPEVGWVLQFLFPKRWEGESAATGTPLCLRRARNFPAKPKSDVPVGALWCAIVDRFRCTTFSPQWGNASTFTTHHNHK